MLVNAFRSSVVGRLTALLLVCGLMLFLPAFAQQAVPQGGQGSISTAPDAGNSGTRPEGIVYQICNPPPTCFATQQARQEWGRQNNCRFLEDVCDKTPASQDNKGARLEDQGFWGGLWNSVEGRLVYGYEFVKGMLAGVKNQLTDLYGMITNVDEVVTGLIELGEAFYNDPERTLKTLAELFGQEAIDNITKATQCGAYDLGRVIGENVSPILMLKLTTRLAHYGDRLQDAVRATKHEFGCTSFAAGTPIFTLGGPVPIERIAAGQKVQSREERKFSEAAQPVTQTFNRTVPNYRLLKTEFGSYRVTDEHPFWVQGKGWTQAKDITDEDVLAAWSGDALVLSNESIQESIQVFNFGVSNTPSYFVGIEGLWAHNAKCKIEAIHLTLPGGKTAKDFEEGLPNLSSGERVARAKEMAISVAQLRGWRKDRTLTRINGRDVYVGNDGFLYALDTQHGRFEKVHPKTGKQQGEFRMDLTFVDDSLDNSRGHDLKVK